MDLETQGLRSWRRTEGVALHICMTTCRMDGFGEAAVQHRELRSVLCDDLEGWDGSGEGEKLEREGINAHEVAKVLEFQL